MENSPSLHTFQPEEQISSIPPNLSSEGKSPTTIPQGEAGDPSVQGYSAKNKVLRNLGSIFTPPEFADYLTSWAIHSSAARVLDLGIGDGAFVWAAMRRFNTLGVSSEAAQRQIYGAEVYEPAYTKFMQTAKSQDLSFPNLIYDNFFSLEFPKVDAIIGNPPYVRRQYISDIDGLKRSISEKQPEIAKNLSRMTDLYVYFLIRASNYLKDGGRLAVIVADSWLGANYGAEFKEFLKQNFEIQRLVSFDRKVFDVDVRAIMLLATKRRKIKKSSNVDFVRMKNGLPVQFLENRIDALRAHEDVSVFSIQQNYLDINQIWQRYFSDADILHELSSHHMMTHFEELAKTRIGIQTLAKEFFVLTPDFIRKQEIEDEYVVPMIHSIRTVANMVVERGSPTTYHLFYCGKTQKELTGTNALRHILRGEATTVPVRGKNQTVVGYHMKERIQRDHRLYWYDLTQELKRRGNATILIPRLIYKNLTIVWNKAQYVPGELFIEFILPEQSIADTEAYLAILSSSIMEIMIRSQAHVYGGGTYNISPGLIKKAPLLDLRKVSPENRQRLGAAYTHYTTDPTHSRQAIDAIIEAV